MAVLCPVCDGSGTYTASQDFNSTACPQKTPCHGCNGKGWVTETVTTIKD